MCNTGVVDYLVDYWMQYMWFTSDINKKISEFISSGDICLNAVKVVPDSVKELTLITQAILSLSTCSFVENMLLRGKMFFNSV